MVPSLFFYLYILLNVVSPVSIGLCVQIVDGSTTANHAIYRRASWETESPLARSLAAGHLLAKTDELQLNLSDQVDISLLNVLERTSLDLRPSRGYKESADITLNVSMRAWSLLHERTRMIVTERIKLAEITLNDTLSSANVSSGCLDSINQVLIGARRMESWAIKMIAAWSDFPPDGLFEGTYSEVGSYQTCVEIPANNFIHHAHYCSLFLRPILPSPDKYKLILRKEPQELLNLFGKPNPRIKDLPIISDRSRDAFRDLLDHAQYFHYVSLKIGSCWPIQCTPFDIARVMKDVAKRNLFMRGPVKCFSKYEDDYEEPGSVETRYANGSEPIKRKLAISVWDLNDGIFISKPHFTGTQKVALLIVGSIFAFICLMTMLDIVVYRIPDLLVTIKFKLASSSDVSDPASLSGTLKINRFADNPGICDANMRESEQVGEFQSDELNLKTKQHNHYLPVATSKDLRETNFSGPIIDDNKYSAMILIKDCSIVTSLGEFFSISDSQMRNIMCLDGIRCLTMAWIILTHTMMYNDWSAFARTTQVEKSITSLIGQPIFNGSYLVDSFFLMSGLLSAYTAFRHCKGLPTKFHSLAYIINRWLRLTPQIFLVSMLFIILPALSDGPHWFPMTNEYSENCAENWWINTLHLQAFYKTERMCNFVTWWISIDFFYHIFAVAIIWILLRAGHKWGFLSIAFIIGGHVAWQAARHFRLRLPPNIFSTIPQSGTMWTEMVQGFYWTPYSHSAPFFFGFYLGYLMALKRKLIKRWLSPKRAAFGWLLTGTWFFVQSFSSYSWVVGEAGWSRWFSTVYHITCPILWAACLCWVITACHHDYGGIVNSLLTSRVFIILGRASYLVYLSHFQIMFLFFGNMNVLLEPSLMIMTYVILGNVTLSTVYGVALSVVFELPWLRAQKRIIKLI